MNFITKYIINHEIEKKQKEVNEKYKKEGPTDKIIEKQADINQVRNFFNIPDPNEKIYKEFVQ